MGEQRSKIELIAEAGIPALQKAFDRIKGRRSTIGQILQDVNAELTDLGVLTVGQSAFYRWAGSVRRGRINRPVAASQPAAPTPLELVRAFLCTMPGTATSIAAALRALADEIDPAK